MSKSDEQVVEEFEEAVNMSGKEAAHKPDALEKV